MVKLKLEFPQNFFASEERCGYTVSADMKKIWAVELDLLAQVMHVCQHYSIPYYVDGGTLLGAIRHDGFIPWDNDIDLVMLRDDYDRFCQIAPQQFQDPYFFQTEETDPGSMRGHIQIRNSETTAILAGERTGRFKFNQGVFIDIFPLDEVPNVMEELDQFATELDYTCTRAAKKAEWTARYQTASVLWQRPVKYMRHCIAELLHVSYKKEYQAYLATQKKYHHQNTGFVADTIWCPCSSNGQSPIAIENYRSSLLHKFEFLEVPVPVGYEHVLNILYGDWHKFVIGNDDHGRVFFDTDNPYTKYI